MRGGMITGEGPFTVHTVADAEGKFTLVTSDWPGDIAAWRDAGGSHISVVTMGANLTTVDGHIGAIRRWRDVYDTVV